MIGDSLPASSLVSATSTQSPVITSLLPKLRDTLQLLLFLQFSVATALSLQYCVLMAMITTLSCVVAHVYSLLFGPYLHLTSCCMISRKTQISLPFSP